MKTIFSRAVYAAALVACLNFSARAKPSANVIPSHTTAVSDTGKMAKDKMKMAKMEKKKMVKMDKMKMEKKMMTKDTGKM